MLLFSVHGLLGMLLFDVLVMTYSRETLNVSGITKFSEIDNTTISYSQHPHVAITSQCTRRVPEALCTMFSLIIGRVLDHTASECSHFSINPLKPATLFTNVAYNVTYFISES
jgi:hypothetical protein